MSLTEVEDDTTGFEEIESEKEDLDASLPSYEVLTYPADYVLDVLVKKFEDGDIVVPNFQRGFVWKRPQASRLIDSFLRGLPVPAIFLYAEPDTEKLLVVDGQQRLKSIAYFFSGYFGEPSKGKRQVFSLTGLDDNSPHEGKTYKQLQAQLPNDFLRLKNSVLRSFVMRQLSPTDDSSIYHVFERLNTGGTQLSPQEIRNCVHHGKFNDLLSELNENAAWRKVFGSPTPERRQRDVEMILRFLAFVEAGDSYVKPMKHFLNMFMRHAQGFQQDERERLKRLFLDTTETVLETLGSKPFHIRAGFNAAVFDSVYAAFARNLDKPTDDLKKRYKRLVKDEVYLQHITSGTTDVGTVKERLRIASETLFDATQ